MGSAEGISPFAGCLRVSLRYNLSPFLTRKGARESALSKACGELVEPSNGMVERVFERLARGAKVKLHTTLAPPATMPNGLQATDDGLRMIDQATEEIHLLDAGLKLIRTIASPTENASGITVGGGYFWTGSNAPATARYPRPSDTGTSAILKCDVETGPVVQRSPLPMAGAFTASSGWTACSGSQLSAPKP